MKAGTIRRMLSLAFMLTATSQMATATVTVDGYFRLGENDPGAAAGQPGQNPTRDANGIKAIPIGAGIPTNIAVVGSTAIARVGSTLAMRFDGTSYYLTNTVLSTANNNYGIEAWFQPLSTNGGQIITANGGSATAFALWLYDGEIRGYYENGTIVPSGITVNTGTWYHAAFVLTSGVACIYVNGALCNSGIPTGSPLPTSCFTIGAYTLDGANCFDGAVDEVRLFHFNPGEFQATDLLYSPTNVSSTYTAVILAANPVAYYRMNESEGPGLFDMATNASPSTQQGAQQGLYRKRAVPTISLTTNNGPRTAGFEAGNTAPYFAGTNTMDSAYSVLPTIGTNYSVEMWIRSSRDASAFALSYFAGRGSSGFDAIAIDGTFGTAPLGPSDHGKLFVFNNANAVIGSTVLTTGTWHHVAFTREDNVVAIYLDGRLDGSGTLANNVGASSTFVFGDRSDTSGRYLYPFQGNVDEVAVYDRALTASEVADHFYGSVLSGISSAISTPYTRAVLNSDPLAYYRMDETNGAGMADAATQASPSPQQGSQTGLYRKDTTNAPEPRVTGNGPRPTSFLGFVTNNTAQYFNGTAWGTGTDNGYAVMPTLGNDYSVELWVYNMRPLAETAITGYVAARGNSTFDSLGIGGSAVGQGLLFAFNAATVVAGTTPLALNRWYHVVLARSGTTVALYLNGAPEASGPLTPVFTTSTFSFGVRSDNLYPFKGYLDEVAIYDRALTPAEVAVHYQRATKGTAGMLLYIL